MAGVIDNNVVPKGKTPIATGIRLLVHLLSDSQDVRSAKAFLFRSFDEATNIALR